MMQLFFLLIFVPTRLATSNNRFSIKNSNKVFEKKLTCAFLFIYQKSQNRLKKNNLITIYQNKQSDLFNKNFKKNIAFNIEPNDKSKHSYL